eukprot:CAMPEP_0194509578 /NCGR_PEP_ID=MMETSP0253-20130528/40477_1 /TAXON_ID=2966 /ORGANISM="Noctiluca scintillans" /LENGTH=74 /DNA_ID=CAMNT_0039352747 /DNA_START=117 /DNA_END=338 /DNA_ORIENTATION=-
MDEAETARRDSACDKFKLSVSTKTDGRDKFSQSAKVDGARATTNFCAKPISPDLYAQGAKNFSYPSSARVTSTG